MCTRPESFAIVLAMLFGRGSRIVKKPTLMSGNSATRNSIQTFQHTDRSPGIGVSSDRGSLILFFRSEREVNLFNSGQWALLNG